MRESIIIPELYCPFPSIMHPESDALGQYALNWVQHFGLIQTDAAYQRFLDAHYWELIARAYPSASFTDLQIACDWNCWGFLLDDVDDESPIASDPSQMKLLFADIRHILLDETPSFLRGPLIEALQDVWFRISEVTAPEWRQQFRNILGAGLDAYEWESANRMNGQIPPRERYILERQQTGGWLTDVALITITSKLPRAMAIFDNEQVQMMLSAANNTICWSNDLYSLEKEIARADVHNLVMITQHEHHCSLQKAVDIVAAMHDDEVRRFAHLSSCLPMFGDERDLAMQAYVAFCQNFMRGNIDWSLTTGRYTQKERLIPNQLPSYLDQIIQARH